MGDTQDLFVVRMLASLPVERKEENLCKYKLYVEFAKEACYGNALNTCKPRLAKRIESSDWKIEDYDAEQVSHASLQNYREYARKNATEKGVFNMSLYAVAAFVNVGDGTYEVQFELGAATTEQIAEAGARKSFADKGLEVIATCAKRIPRELLPRD